MCFEPDGWDDYGQPELAALADLCRATFPRCAVLADRAQFCTDIAHISQLPWFIRQATDIDAEDFFS